MSPALTRSFSRLGSNKHQPGPLIAVVADVVRKVLPGIVPVFVEQLDRVGKGRLDIHGIPSSAHASVPSAA